MPTATPTETHTTLAATIVEKLEQAWNAADGAAFGTQFADESDFVNVRGEHHRGATAIARGHQGIFDTIYAGSTVGYELDVARVVSPGCIVAVATSTLDAPSGPLRGVNHSRITAIITEQGGRWAIAAFQNTLVRQDS
jgi:uncharacterized protein (TIGR02246 family)